jgi:hypothetical protein
MSLACMLESVGPPSLASPALSRSRPSAGLTDPTDPTAPTDPPDPSGLGAERAARMPCAPKPVHVCVCVCVYVCVCVRVCVYVCVWCV